jgi:hypothetical protein
MIRKLILVLLVCVSVVVGSLRLPVARASQLFGCSWINNGITFYRPSTTTDPCYGYKFAFNMNFSCSTGNGYWCTPLYYKWSIYRVSCDCNFNYVDSGTCTMSNLSAACGQNANPQVLCVSLSWLVCGNYYYLRLALFDSVNDCNNGTPELAYKDVYLYWSCIYGWSVVNPEDPCWC